jgi:hypothetical protein
MTKEGALARALAAYCLCPQLLPQPSLVPYLILFVLDRPHEAHLCSPWLLRPAC